MIRHDPDDIVTIRRRMVDSQLRPSGVTDVAVLAAMDRVPRERFVPEQARGAAYRDTIVWLEGGRGINPPLATARLIQAARVVPGQRVLVVGAATGYVVALLAEMGAVVTALEEDSALAVRARQVLDGHAAVEVVEGPLASGHAAAAPFDIIYLDGAVERIPDMLVDQLADGGVLVGGVLASAGERIGGAARAGATVERGLTHLVEGRRTAGRFATAGFADVEMAPLPGFAPAAAFAF